MTIRNKFSMHLEEGFVIEEETDSVLFVEKEDGFFEKNLEFFYRFLNGDYDQLILVKEKNDFFSLISIDKKLQIPLPVFLGWMDIPLENILDNCYSGGGIIVWRENPDQSFTSGNTRYRSCEVIEGKEDFYNEIIAKENKEVMDIINHIMEGGMVGYEIYGSNGYSNTITAVKEEEKLRFTLDENFEGPARRVSELSFSELLEELDSESYEIYY